MCVCLCRQWRRRQQNASPHHTHAKEYAHSQRREQRRKQRWRRGHADRSKEQKGNTTVSPILWSNRAQQDRDTEPNTTAQRTPGKKKQWSDRRCQKANKTTRGGGEGQCSPQQQVEHGKRKNGRSVAGASRAGTHQRHRTRKGTNLYCKAVRVEDEANGRNRSREWLNARRS